MELPQWAMTMGFAFASAALGVAAAWGRAGARIAELDVAVKKLGDEVRVLSCRLGDVAEKVAVLRDRDLRESGLRGRR